MPIGAEEFLQRNNRNEPIGKRSFTFKGITAGKTVTSNEIKTLNGYLQGIRYSCPQLATDVVFDIQFKDADGVLWFEDNAVPASTSAETKAIRWFSSPKPVASKTMQAYLTFADNQTTLDSAIVIEPILTEA